MPGTYQHEIMVDIDTSMLKNCPINLPSEFSDVQHALETDLLQIKDKIEYSVPEAIIPLSSQFSQDYQRQSLMEYDSIISGDLKESIEIQLKGNASTIGTSLFYAEYVNDGRGPVYPVRKKCLHYITKTGDEVFAKSSGPARPRPYLEDSFNRLDGKIDEIVTNVLDVCFE